MVMSEFRRTTHKNGNMGNDHGHGNVMLLLGGSVQGGRIYGEWPGLQTNQLYQGLDLAITTNYRDVLSMTLGYHFNLSTGQLAQVVPEYQAAHGMETFFHT
jgi:uncharacterized protein (DUF1501 family)